MILPRDSVTLYDMFLPFSGLSSIKGLSNDIEFSDKLVISKDIKDL